MQRRNNDIRNITLTEFIKIRKRPITEYEMQQFMYLQIVVIGENPFSYARRALNEKKK